MPFPNTSQRRRHDKAANNESADDDNDTADDRDDIGLLSRKRIRFVKDNAPNVPRHNWMRPYWLGVGLFLVLFPFWLLDSLKDPILGALTDSNLERHQPPAKLFSVCTTLALVCFLEYFSHEKKRQHRLEKIRSEQEVLEAGGSWNRMPMASDPSSSTEVSDDAVPGSIFALIGLPYCLAFGIMAYLLQFNPNVALTDAPEVTFGTNPQRLWATLGYFFFAAIESYGSLSVAAFWSYTNSTLSLEDAESFYGPIIAIAQLGAVCGSTMVTMQVWSNITLVVLACLIILLHILVMTAYNKRFPPTNKQIQEESNRDETTSNAEPTLWSGVYLILKHNYVLLIFGASSLYEISLTCLNYQMTLLGWRRFEETEHEDITFKQFMGHYGQMVNVTSLILSSMVFPALMRHVGLKSTLRIFPTLLLAVNVLVFGFLRGNLAVLFLSVSLLKAMMYSIHDPSTELLYLPTSSAIKFKSKFWIDVVGARVAKAVGSSINTLAGSVDRSIRMASAPSLLTAAALWVVCYYVGETFDSLVEDKIVVGLDDPIVADELEYNHHLDHLEMEPSENSSSDEGDDSMFAHALAPMTELSNVSSTTTCIKT